MERESLSQPELRTHTHTNMGRTTAQVNIHTTKKRKGETPNDAGRKQTRCRLTTRTSTHAHPF